MHSQILIVLGQSADLFYNQGIAWVLLNHISSLLSYLDCLRLLVPSGRFVGLRWTFWYSLLYASCMFHVAPAYFYKCTLSDCYYIFFTMLRYCKFALKLLQKPSFIFSHTLKNKNVRSVS